MEHFIFCSLVYNSGIDWCDELERIWKETVLA